MTSKKVNHELFSLDPLVTYALVTYNQEKYIRSSLESALSQTYSPLEIIISDDASTDQTFEIIKEITKTYNGPHKLVLNRNKNNLGISSHINKIDNLACGEIIIHAAGDDISLPNRVETIVNYWTKNDCKPDAIISNGIRIDENNNALGILAPDHKSSFWMCTQSAPFYQVIGCTLAVSKYLINYFSAPDKNIIAEDTVIYRRAELLNGILFIPEKLVLYREHKMSTMKTGTQSIEDFIRWEKKWARDTLLRCKQLEDDINLFKKKQNSTTPRLNIRSFGNYIKKVRRKISVLEGNFLESILGLTKQILTQPTDIHTAREFIKIITFRICIYFH